MVLTRLRRHLAAYALLAPAFLLLGAVLIYPALRNIYLSFWNWRLTAPDAVRFVGLDNYVRFAGDTLFWQALRFTVVFTALTILLEFLLGLVSALLLNSLQRGRRLISTLVLLPYMIAPIAVGLGWRLLWARDYGLVNWALGLVGVDKVNWLGSPGGATVATVVTEVWRSTPFVTVILLAGLAAIPAEVFEAARVDGAGPGRQLTRIVLPLLRPSLTIALLFQTIFKLRLFDLVYIMTGGGPGNATMPFGILVYRTYFRYLDGGYAAALSVVLLVLGGLVSYGYLRWVYREVEY